MRKAEKMTDWETFTMVKSLDRALEPDTIIRLREAQEILYQDRERGLDRMRETCYGIARSVLEETGMYHCFGPDNGVNPDSREYRERAVDNFVSYLSKEVFSTFPFE